MTMNDELFRDDYLQGENETMSLKEYFELCASDKMTYASSAERMLGAIGECALVDTSKDERLSRIFMNRTIRQYPAFADFHGMEDTIESIVGYFRHSAQGLEERKQILYLLGPVGGGKSSLAERLKDLMEVHPIYVLVSPDGEISPVFESPLGLYQTQAKRKEFSDKYNIPIRYFNQIPSPWAVKRSKEFKAREKNTPNSNDLQFRVMKMYPSKLEQIALMKTEPGDENNQDISALVGKVDIRMMERFKQSDTDCYNYSGGLCRSNQGMLEFVEMFKAPIKMLHPLLTATQEGNYVGTEALPAIPYSGTILAHSNESEWLTFRSNKNNEAFLDRICVIKVPYCLRVSDEIKIYEKMIQDSGLANAPIAPKTFDIMAQFSVLSRLSDHENSTQWSKMRVLNGEDLREDDPRAKTLQEYRDAGGVSEGMDGESTRFAYKILSQTYNFEPDEIAADPVHLMFVIEEAIKKEQYDKEKQDKLIAFVKVDIAEHYAEFLGNEIQKAYLESYSEYGQNMFMRYLNYADAWIQNIDYKDPDTGLMLNRSSLNDELEKIEKPFGVSNVKDFRHEVVNFCIRAKAKNGIDVRWNEYAKMRDVIEKRMFGQLEDMLPVISFGVKQDSDTEKKHSEYVDRMKEKGYTDKQIRRMTEWFMRMKKSGS
jgi:serine protein kinase